MEQGHCTLIAVKRYRDPHGLVDGIIFYCDLTVLTRKIKVSLFLGDTTIAAVARPAALAGAGIRTLNPFSGAGPIKSCRERAFSTYLAGPLR